MTKATYVLAFFLGVLVIYAWHQHTAALEASKPSYLFLLNGTVTDVQKQVTYSRDGTIALSIQPAQVMQFTDRPYHLAKTIGWKDLELHLTNMIHEQKNPPNATLVDANDKPIIMEIVDVTNLPPPQDLFDSGFGMVKADSSPQLIVKVLQGNFFPTGAASPFVGQGISITIDNDTVDPIWCSDPEANTCETQIKCALTYVNNKTHKDNKIQTDLGNTRYRGKQQVWWKDKDIEDSWTHYCNTDGTLEDTTWTYAPNKTKNLKACASKCKNLRNKDRLKKLYGYVHVPGDEDPRLSSRSTPAQRQCQLPFKTDLGNLKYNGNYYDVKPRTDDKCDGSCKQLCCMSQMYFCKGQSLDVDTFKKCIKDRTCNWDDITGKDINCKAETEKVLKNLTTKEACESTFLYAKGFKANGQYEYKSAYNWNDKKKKCETDPYTKESCPPSVKDVVNMPLVAHVDGEPTKDVYLKPLNDGHLVHGFEAAYGNKNGGEGTVFKGLPGAETSSGTTGAAATIVDIFRPPKMPDFLSSGGFILNGLFG